MAAIEKIYLNKTQALEFMDYIEKVDKEFQEFFVNCKSLMDFCHVRKDYVLSMPDDEHVFPVMNTPVVVDRWLYQRDDCPDFIKVHLLDVNYGGCEKTLLEKIYKNVVMPDVGIGTKAKMIKRSGIFTNSNNPVTCFDIEAYDGPVKSGFGYFEDCDEWISDSNENNAYIVGRPHSTAYSGKPIKSLKSLIRKIRKWKLPKGTHLRVSDFRYDGEMIFVVR